MTGISIRSAWLMGWAPWLVGGAAMPLALREKLAAPLLGQDLSLRMSEPLFLLDCAMTAWGLHAIWPMVWFCVALPCFVQRAMVCHGFRRTPGSRTPELWVRRFSIGSVGLALAWGGLGFSLMAWGNDLTRMVHLSLASGFIAGINSRNNTSPRLCLVQLAVSILPAGLGLVASGEIYLIVFAIAPALLFAFALGTSRQMGRQTMLLLHAELEQRRLLDEVSDSNRRLASLSRTDELTGLANRRGFQAVLAEEWRRAAREGGMMSALMVDVDHFKKYNDSFGHPAGDECLRLVAAALAAAINRPGDVVARYGGEEFVIILPGTGPEGAQALAECARQTVAALALEHPQSPIGRVSVSIGGASLPVAAGVSASTLLQRADTALYRAKRRGRDCTQMAAVHDAAREAS